MNKHVEILSERLVREGVLCCDTTLVEMLLRKEIIPYEEMENYYIDNTDAIRTVEDELEGIDDSEPMYHELLSELEDLKESHDTYNEPMEWWRVSHYLAEYLRERGEVIIDNDYGIWWGRTCTGQSIKLDAVIQDIAKEILK